MGQILQRIVERQKQGEAIGIYSACTGNRMALEACMLHAKKNNTPLLIEATANQVDQYGGYTGMKPTDFVQMIRDLSKESGLGMDRIILGGDHLGPLTFVQYEEEKAMQEASELIRQYVLAGFTKIHVDTSMKVASDDADTRLSDETIAKRGARLVEVAEKAYLERLQTNPDAMHPVYVVGSEVPIPGGSQEVTDSGVQVTTVESFQKTVATFQEAFRQQGVEDAWQHVIAVVVQPGVEEKDSGCTEYNRDKAKDLMAAITDYPNLMFEGHSTDYQTKYKLRELVEDGVGILKVGPGITHALRQGIFALAFAEKEAYADQPDVQSHFMEVLDANMLAEPKYYHKHYHGTKSEIALKRKYSFSDRCRYYLPMPSVEQALVKLMENFKEGVPLNLLSQFMPVQYRKVRTGELRNDPKALIYDHVAEAMDEYLYATKQDRL